VPEVSHLSGENFCHLLSILALFSKLGSGFFGEGKDPCDGELDSRSNGSECVSISDELTRQKRSQKGAIQAFEKSRNPWNRQDSQISNLKSAAQFVPNAADLTLEIGDL
jgi:hypothetical protein